MPQKIRLPSIIEPENRYKVGSILITIFLILYVFTNRIHIFHPHTIASSWVDLKIPLMPHSIWVYFTFYFIIATPYILGKNKPFLNRTAYAYLTLCLLSNFFFMAYPTAYSHRVYPELFASTDLLTKIGFGILHLADTTTNCLPSLHVSMAFLAAFIWYKHNKKRFFVFNLWATLIFISTLTTKQHYFVDGVSGFFLAILCYLVFFYWLEF